MLLVVMVVFRPSPAASPENPAPAAEAGPLLSIVSEPKAEPPQTASPSRSAAHFNETELPPDEEIERLQEYLDANDNDAIVEQASFLAESEDPRRREEAIDALMWVSTPKAGMALLPLLRDQDEETYQAALSAMAHILNTIGTQIGDDSATGELVVGGSGDDKAGLDEDELQESFELWVAACMALDNADDLEFLLISLTGLDVKFSVPVLVEVLEGTTGEMQEKAAWYLDVATNSDGVTNRDEAMLWLQEQGNGF